MRAQYLNANLTQLKSLWRKQNKDVNHPLYPTIQHSTYQWISVIHGLTRAELSKHSIKSIIILLWKTEAGTSGDISGRKCEFKWMDQQSVTDQHWCDVFHLFNSMLQQLSAASQQWHRLIRKVISNGHTWIIPISNKPGKNLTWRTFIHSQIQPTTEQTLNQINSKLIQTWQIYKQLKIDIVKNRNVAQYKIFIKLDLKDRKLDQNAHCI